MLVLWQMLVFPGALFLISGSLLIAWLDRKIIAKLQGRVGPPWYQPLADMLKLLSKEDIMTVDTDALMATLLPLLAVASTLAAGMYIPVGNRAVMSFEGDLIIVVFLLAIPTLGYFLAGWASGGVYGVLGGNRSLLQYFSYEVPLLIGLSAPALYSGSWQILALMDAQRAYRWHLFSLPVGFFVALIGLIGKLKRVPFDIPHAKTEIGAGPLTDYSGRKLALWKLTIMLQTLVGLNLLVAVYMGGADRMWGAWGYLIYGIKIMTLLAGLAAVQALYARLRIDQMAQLGWRALVPLGLAQMLIALWISGG
jgi:NADH-quinone oxidoreductase subunit H